LSNISQKSIIGIDVSRDYLDIFHLPQNKWLRFENNSKGHNKLVQFAQKEKAMVCFEATGGHEWQLWVALEKADVVTRQLPPAQIKAFAASYGIRAKTDAFDAELIARFMVFRPHAGRQLPHQKLRLIRALTTKRSQLVEARKRLVVQTKAHNKQGNEALFLEADAALFKLLDEQIASLEQQIKAAIDQDKELAQRADILCSTPGVGFVTCSMLIAEMPELGQISNKTAAALIGLAPIARDSGTYQGKRSIKGGRKSLRNILYQAALVASCHNPQLKAFAERLKKAGKPHKLVITAVARKLLTILNSMCKSQKLWDEKAI
jgi:transposase